MIVCVRRSMRAHSESQLALLRGREQDLRQCKHLSVRQTKGLTKASHISIERSFVSEVKAEMVKFLATVATRILSMMLAKFCPPQTREPVPNAIMFWLILMKHRQPRNRTKAHSLTDSADSPLPRSCPPVANVLGGRFPSWGTAPYLGACSTLVSTRWSQVAVRNP